MLLKNAGRLRFEMGNKKVTDRGEVKSAGEERSLQLATRDETPNSCVLIATNPRQTDSSE